MSMLLKSSSGSMCRISLLTFLAVVALGQCSTIPERQDPDYLQFQIIELQSKLNGTLSHSLPGSFQKPVLRVTNIQMSELIVPMKRTLITDQAKGLLVQLLKIAPNADDKDCKSSENTKDATIENATVEDATIENATVEDATIENATVEDATIENATVEDATIENATIENATIEATIERPTIADKSNGTEYETAPKKKHSKKSS